MKVSIGRYPKKINAERKVKIQIDPYDTWSMDHTLALIIHPMLIQLQKTKHGSPLVDDADVPEELRSTTAPPRVNDWDIDDNHHKRWEWVLDEMIWAFAQVVDDDAESQFHTGTIDHVWIPVKVGDEELHELTQGPKHTHVFDREGWEKWNDRKRNGFRLFGKYYESLWD